ncbi:hypothetical protein [Paenibacillus albiflavus]|uniref:hypothetical protein n=1 Tax=Paenibacillus albiflavus TaxID=2545760 RepID=UPI001F1C9BD1|nr:hypothetical protein [Paenibacillus albiflavus]
MSIDSQVLVLLIIVSIAVSWATLRFRRWLDEPKRNLPVPIHDDIPSDEAVELLEGAGFDVLSSKTRIPLYITINDAEEPLYSRLFIDFFVQKNEELYLVKLARERRPLDMTGSGLRDAFLAYQLLFPDASGVLYVDMNQQKIKKISFHVEV